MQPEDQPGLGREDDVLLAGQSRHCRTGSGSHRTADERAFTAGGKGTDKGAAATTAADQGEIPLPMVSAVAADRAGVQFVRGSVHMQRVKRQPDREAGLTRSLDSRLPVRWRPGAMASRSSGPRAN